MNMSHLQRRHFVASLWCRKAHNALLRNLSTHALDGSQPSSITILGGGVIGCAIAYHLASHPKSSLSSSIRVVEQDPTYKRASTTLSAGGIRQQFSMKENILMSLYGIDFIKNIAAHLATNDTLDHPPNVQFVEGGYLMLASQEGVDILHSNHLLQTKLGAQIELMTPQTIQDRFPWINVEDISGGALGVKNEGWFDPWSLLGALRKKAASLGVEFVHGKVYDVQVAQETPHARKRILGVGILKSNESVQQLTSDIFVNAAGPWAATIESLCGFHDLPIEKRKRSVFVFHCAEESIYKGRSASPLVVDPTGVYFRREGRTGTFICGVSPPNHEDVDCLSDDALDFPDYALFEETIWPALAHRVPSFEAIKVLNAWSGFYDYNTLDQNALIGKHLQMENLYVANGFSGHGLQQAPAVGRALAELIYDGEFQTIDLSRFSMERVYKHQPLYERNIV